MKTYTTSTGDVKNPFGSAWPGLYKPKPKAKKEKVCKHNWQLFCVPMSLAVRAVCQKCLVSQMVKVEPKQEG